LFFLAARLLESMDASVDPCEDFFEYACGSWNKVNDIPEDRSSYDTFSKLRDIIHVQIKGKLSSEEDRLMFKWHFKFKTVTYHYKH